MSDRRFVVLSTDELSEAQRADIYVPEWADYCNALVDTKTGEVLGTDGGEPEDQTLTRDWAWVAAALNRLVGP